MLLSIDVEGPNSISPDGSSKTELKFEGSISECADLFTALDGLNTEKAKLVGIRIASSIIAKPENHGLGASVSTAILMVQLLNSQKLEKYEDCEHLQSSTVKWCQSHKTENGRFTREAYRCHWRYILARKLGYSSRISLPDLINSTIREHLWEDDRGSPARSRQDLF